MRRAVLVLVVACAVLAAALVAARAGAGRRDPGRRVVAEALARFGAGDAADGAAHADLALRVLDGSPAAASLSALGRAANGDLAGCLARAELAAERDAEDAAAALQAGLVARAAARRARPPDAVAARARRWLDEATRRADAVPGRPFDAALVGAAARIAAGDGAEALARSAALRPSSDAEREQAVLVRAAAWAVRGALDAALRAVREAVDAAPTPRLSAAAARLEAWAADEAVSPRDAGLRAWAAGDADRAASALGRWADAHPADLAALAVLAAALARGGTEDEAVRRYERLAAEEPAAAAWFRGCHALASGRPSDAARALDAALGLGAARDAPALRTMLGVARAADGDAAGAEAAYRAALAADPSHAPASLRLADLLRTHGRCDEADAVLATVAPGTATHRSAVASGPTDVAAHLALGARLARAGDAKGARRAFDAALRVEPTSVDAHLGLLGLAGTAENVAERSRVLAELAAAHPRDARPSALLGAAAELSGDVDAAASHYRRALAVDPGCALAANNLAWLLAVRRGRPGEALPYAERALRLLPSQPQVLDTAGWVRHLCGDAAGAEPLLRRAAAALPADAAVARRHAHAAAAVAARGKESSR